jgi:protease II
MHQTHLTTNTTHHVAARRLCCEAASAGASVVAAALNARPSLLAAAALSVPVLDVLMPNLLQDMDCLELGRARASEQRYRQLAAWCPMRNLQRQQYPHLLVRAARQDARAPYWLAAKYVAKMRALVQGGAGAGDGQGRMLLLRVEDGDHDHFAGAEGEAAKYGFFLQALGLLKR